MHEATLIFDIHTYWHAGSGRGRSAVLDAEVIRDRAGLPYLPGKTVKGLLRKAVRLGERLEMVPQGVVERIFGSAVPGLEEATPDTQFDDGDDFTTFRDAQQLALESGRFATQPGTIWFGSAELPDAWRAWATGLTGEARSQLEGLFHTVASTAIDEDGVAREHTLRVVEATVPMVLEATIAGDHPQWAEDLEHIRACLPLLRAVGSRTRRGYGRVTIKLRTEGA